MRNNDRSNFLSGPEIKNLLNEIGTEFCKRKIWAEIAIYGGAAILLLFETRMSTRDIDFMSVNSDSEKISAIANKIGKPHGLPNGWFNDAVKIFASNSPEYQFFGDFPPGGDGGLRVFTASPKYLLAMKMIAMRSSLETHDIKDIWDLLDKCDVKDVSGAQDIFGKFFPDEVLPERNIALLKDIIEDKIGNREYDPMRFW